VNGKKKRKKAMHYLGERPRLWVKEIKKETTKGTTGKAETFKSSGEKLRQVRRG